MASNYEVLNNSLSHVTLDPTHTYEIQQITTTILGLGAHHGWRLHDVTDDRIVAEIHAGAISPDLVSDPETARAVDLWRSIGSDADDFGYLQAMGELFSEGFLDNTAVLSGNNIRTGDTALLEGMWNSALDEASFQNPLDRNYSILDALSDDGYANSNTGAYNLGIKAFGFTRDELNNSVDDNGLWDPGFDRTLGGELNSQTDDLGGYIVGGSLLDFLGLSTTLNRYDITLGVEAVQVAFNGDDIGGLFAGSTGYIGSASFDALDPNARFATIGAYSVNVSSYGLDLDYSLGALSLDLAIASLNNFADEALAALYGPSVSVGTDGAGSDGFGTSMVDSLGFQTTTVNGVQFGGLNGSIARTYQGMVNQNGLATLEDVKAAKAAVAANQGTPFGSARGITSAADDQDDTGVNKGGQGDSKAQSGTDQGNTGRGGFSGGRAAANGLNPIALDLDGDGEVTFVAMSDSTAFYDLDGDGFREHLAWVAGNDGFLAYDKDSDGLIEDGDELSFVSYVEGAETDLEGLAYFDSIAGGGDDDGTLDADDAEWSKFRVWQDADQDGVSDEGELKTLDELGITSIDLTSDNVETTYANGDVTPWRLAA